MPESEREKLFADLARQDAEIERLRQRREEVLARLGEIEVEKQRPPKQESVCG